MGAYGLGTQGLFLGRPVRARKSGESRPQACRALQRRGDGRCVETRLRPASRAALPEPRAALESPPAGAARQRQPPPCARLSCVPAGWLAVPRRRPTGAGINKGAQDRPPETDKTRLGHETARSLISQPRAGACGDRGATPSCAGRWLPLPHHPASRAFQFSSPINDAGPDDAPPC